MKPMGQAMNESKTRSLSMMDQSNKPMGFTLNEHHNYLGHFKNMAIMAQGHNPLTAKGKKIYANMKKEYGPKKGKSVLYASKNAGTISGID